MSGTDLVCISAHDLDGALKRKVARRLLLVLDDRGITQTQLARASGVSRSCISRVLSEERPITTEALVRICIVLNLDAAWVLGLRA